LVNKNKISCLVECAIMVALACVLSFISFSKLPYGGSVTACSMLPIVIAGYRNGPKWGLMTGTVYGLLQLLVLGGVADLKGVGIATVIGSVLFDFLIAFGVLGLGGIFRGRIKNNVVALGTGTFVAVLLRYVSHFVSGAIFFGSYAEWFFTEGAGAAYGQTILDTFTGAGLACVYSVIYNGLYMIPELILETAVAFAVAPLLAKLPQR